MGQWGQSLPPAKALFCTSLKGGTRADSALSFQRVDAASFFQGRTVSLQQGVPVSAHVYNTGIHGKVPVCHFQV